MGERIGSAMNIKVETRTPGRSHNQTLYKIRGEDMKLEEELIRDLLLHIEEHADKPHSRLEDISLKGWTSEQVAYHVMLAEEGGFINATIEDLPDTDDNDQIHISYTVHRLTMQGHELLDVIRDPKYWRAVKHYAKKIRSGTLSVLSVAAKEVLKKAITVGGAA